MNKVVTDKAITFETYSGQAMDLMRKKMASMFPEEE